MLSRPGPDIATSELLRNSHNRGGLISSRFIVTVHDQPTVTAGPSTTTVSPVKQLSSPRATQMSIANGSALPSPSTESPRYKSTGALSTLNRASQTNRQVVTSSLATQDRSMFSVPDLQRNSMAIPLHTSTSGLTITGWSFSSSDRYRDRSGRTNRRTVHLGQYRVQPQLRLFNSSATYGSSTVPTNRLP